MNGTEIHDVTDAPPKTAVDRHRPLAAGVSIPGDQEITQDSSVRSSGAEAPDEPSLIDALTDAHTEMAILTAQCVMVGPTDPRFLEQKERLRLATRLKDELAQPETTK